MPTLDKSKELQERLDWLKGHVHLPPQEAWELARKRWPDIKLTRIHALRHILKAQGVKFPQAKPGGVRTKSERRRAAAKVKKRRPGGLSEATKFVLAQPREMDRAEVIEVARKAGLTLTVKNVSDIRSRHKDLLAAAATETPAEQLAIPEETNGAALAKPTRKYARKAATEEVVLPLGALSTDEADFMGLVLGIGYNRAARLLAQFRQQFFGQLKANTTED
jgi:hypothetical protein